MSNNESFFMTLPERCWRISQSEKQALMEIEYFAEKVGFEAEWQMETLFVRGYVNSAILLGSDPVTNCVACLFVFIGSAWSLTDVGKRILEDTNKMWKIKSRQKKQKENKDDSQLTLFEEE